LCNCGPIRTHGRHVHLGAELGNLLVGHTGAYVSPRHPESSLPAPAIEHLTDVQDGPSICHALLTEGTG